MFETLRSSRGFQGPGRTSGLCLPHLQRGKWPGSMIFSVYLLTSELPGPELRTPVLADNIGQAVEDLSRDWAGERRQFWAIDTGTPEVPVKRHALEVEVDKQAPAALRAVLGRARLKAERAAVASLALHGQEGSAAVVLRNWIPSSVSSMSNSNRRTTVPWWPKGRPKPRC